VFLRRVRVRVRLGFRLGLGLGIGFREWVPIRNIIGGAAGAHILMRFGLQLSACKSMMRLALRLCGETTYAAMMTSHDLMNEHLLRHVIYILCHIIHLSTYLFTIATILLYMTQCVQTVIGQRCWRSDQLHACNWPKTCTTFT